MLRVVAVHLCVRIVGSCAAVAAPAIGTAQDSPRSATSPHFEESPCPFKADDKILPQLRCGYVTVPENRAAPNGRQLRLAVAIVKSTSAAPRPDPVVFIQGGPGQQLLAYAPLVVSGGSFDFLRADRELILFDQRGTGYSEPAFCPQLSVEWGQIRRLGLPRPTRYLRQRDAFARCREVMRAAGVDLSQYQSRAIALDLEDVRLALGYEQWNLLGVSYGTRVGLEAMRSAPRGIRSAILDGPAPPHRPVRVNRSADFADVVRRLAAACVPHSASVMTRTPTLRRTSGVASRRWSAIHSRWTYHAGTARVTPSC